MSVQQLKQELAILSDSERAEVSAFLFHLRHNSDADYQAAIRRRMDDKDPSHWVTLAELESRVAKND